MEVSVGISVNNGKYSYNFGLGRLAESITLENIVEILKGKYGSDEKPNSKNVAWMPKDAQIAVSFKASVKISTDKSRGMIGAINAGIPGHANYATFKSTDTIDTVVNRARECRDNYGEHLNGIVSGISIENIKVTSKLI